MPKNLPQLSDSNLIGFEQRLSISSSLLQRLESSNEEVYFHFMCGKQALFDKRYQSAIAYFDKVESHFEGLPIEDRFEMKLGKRLPFDEYINSLLLRGNTNYSLNQNDDAINDYSKCIVIDNTAFDAFRNRSVCYMNNHQFDLALIDLIQITKGKEYCPEIHRFVAFCYQKLGDLRKSQVHFSISASQGDKESQTIITNKNDK